MKCLIYTPTLVPRSISSSACIVDSRWPSMLYLPHTPASTFFSFSGQKIHKILIAILMPKATHKATCTWPDPRVIQPPAIAPIRIPKKAPARRFRLTLRPIGDTSSGSLAKSQSTEVRTTVGISLNARALDPTICPAAWKLSNAIGASVLQSISLLIWLILPSTSPDSITAAEIRMNIDCRVKDEASVRRWMGPMRRLRREKKRAPRVKQIIEVRDLAQP